MFLQTGFYAGSGIALAFQFGSKFCFVGIPTDILQSYIIDNVILS